MEINRPKRMKTTAFRTIAIAAVSVSLAGCGTGRQDPVSLDYGLYQVGKGLANLKLAELEVLTNSVFRDHGQTNFTLGLFPTDFTYTFNVTASKNHSNQLTIEAAASVPQYPASVKAADTYATAASSGRVNQFTINFASPFFTTTTIITTNKQTVGSNTVTTVEAKVQRSITDPKILREFFSVVYGTNGFAGAGGSSAVELNERIANLEKLLPPANSPQSK